MKYLAIICFIFISSCKSTSSNKSTIIINNNKLFVKVAKTEKEKSLGLMNVKSMPQNEGMLFVFNNKSILNFWMKNTLIPLSIAYIDESCVIVDIQHMQPADKNDPNPPTYPSKKPALYALETNINWFRKNNIKVGEKIILKSKENPFCR